MFIKISRPTVNLVHLYYMYIIINLTVVTKNVMNVDNWSALPFNQYQCIYSNQYM